MNFLRVDSNIPTKPAYGVYVMLYTSTVEIFILGIAQERWTLLIDFVNFLHISIKKALNPLYLSNP